MDSENWHPFTIEDALGLKSVAYRCPIRFSPDGALLAYSVEHFQQQAGKSEEMWVVDVDTGATSQILPRLNAPGDRVGHHPGNGLPSMRMSARVCNCRCGRHPAERRGGSPRRQCLPTFTSMCPNGLLMGLRWCVSSSALQDWPITRKVVSELSENSPLALSCRRMVVSRFAAGSHPPAKDQIRTGTTCRIGLAGPTEPWPKLNWSMAMLCR